MSETGGTQTLDNICRTQNWRKILSILKQCITTQCIGRHLITDKFVQLQKFRFRYVQKMHVGKRAVLVSDP